MPYNPGHELMLAGNKTGQKNSESDTFLNRSMKKINFGPSIRNKININHNYREKAYENPTSNQMVRNKIRSVGRHKVAFPLTLSPPFIFPIYTSVTTLRG